MYSTQFPLLRTSHRYISHINLKMVPRFECHKVAKKNKKNIPHAGASAARRSAHPFKIVSEVINEKGVIRKRYVMHGAGILNTVSN